MLLLGFKGKDMLKTRTSRTLPPQEEVYNIDQEVEGEDDSLACIQVMRKLFVQPDGKLSCIVDSLV